MCLCVLWPHHFKQITVLGGHQFPVIMDASLFTLFTCLATLESAFYAILEVFFCFHYGFFLSIHLRELGKSQRQRRLSVTTSFPKYRQCPPWNWEPGTQPTSPHLDCRLLPPHMDITIELDSGARAGSQTRHSDR